jgi:single-strand DNA-binding protein
MKQITIAGRTGKAGELRHTQGGDTVLSFSVAVDDGYGDKKSTMWFDCSVWGKRAAALAPHIGKGAALTVVGDLGKREHEGKTYLTVRVNELTLQGGGEKRERQPDDGNGSATALDDEIPFAPEFR